MGNSDRLSLMQEPDDVQSFAGLDGGYFAHATPHAHMFTNPTVWYIYHIGVACDDLLRKLISLYSRQRCLTFYR